jgi:rhomboid protease GluP
LDFNWQSLLDKLRGKNSQETAGRPRLCPACGQLVGASASKCYQCGASMNFSLAAASRSMGRLMPATSPASYFILTFSCLMYAATLLATIRSSGGMAAPSGGMFGIFNLGAINGEVLQRFGASLPLPVNLSQPWRFVMAVFLHGSLLHIGMNMWVLMDIAPQIEELYGSARFLFLYVVTGVAGFCISSLTGHFSVGGSASLLGLIGVMLAITGRRGGAAMQMLRGQLIRWLIYIGLFGLFISGIDNWAHAGGLAAGLLLGKIFSDRAPADASERRTASLLGLGALALIVISLVAMLVDFFRKA